MPCRLGVKLGTKESSLSAYCPSVSLAKATASLPGFSREAYFTTYDGSSGFPLYDSVGDFLIYSGELTRAACRPLSGEHRHQFLQLHFDFVGRLDRCGDLFAQGLFPAVAQTFDGFFDGGLAHAEFAGDRGVF